MRALALALAVLGLCSACASSAARPVAAPSVPRFVVVIPTSLEGTDARVESVDARGTIVRTIARKVDAYSASVSPNGRLVAFANSTGLYVEPIRGSGPRRLLTRNGGGFVWSPDSKKLLVAVSGGSRLAVVTVETGAQRLLPGLGKHSDYSYSPIAWSGPADEILVEIDSGNWSYTLLVARPTGASARTVYSDDSGGDGYPIASLSPDGRWVAYTFEITGEEDWGFGVVDVASGKTTEFDNTDQFLQEPIWSPDSSRFALGGYRRPVEVFSDRGVRLGPVSHSLNPVAWTPDGIYLLTDPGGRPGGGARLALVPTGQTAAKTLFYLPHLTTQVMPLG